MLLTGSWGVPATAEPNPTAVIQNIDKILRPPAQQTWDEAIAPQLAKRDADLEAQRVAEEAKRAAEAAELATLTQPSQPIPVAREVQPSGSCQQWMAQAGISDPGNAYNIFMAESGCRFQAINGSSGAYGVCQSLPGSKMASAGADWQSNPITQMRWCNSYAIERYGSWANAWYFWTHNRWW